MINWVLARRAPHHGGPCSGQAQGASNERLEQDCSGQGEQEQDQGRHEILATAGLTQSRDEASARGVGQAPSMRLRGRDGNRRPAVRASGSAPGPDAARPTLSRGALAGTGLGGRAAGSQLRTTSTSTDAVPGAAAGSRRRRSGRRSRPARRRFPNPSRRTEISYAVPRNSRWALKPGQAAGRTGATRRPSKVGRMPRIHWVAATNAQAAAR